MKLATLGLVLTAARAGGARCRTHGPAGDRRDGERRAAPDAAADDATAGVPDPASATGDEGEPGLDLAQGAAAAMAAQGPPVPPRARG